MISFTPTPEQAQLIDVIRRFATQDVQPIAHDADESGGLPARVLDDGYAIGLVPTFIPEELGGMGELSAITHALAYEELAYGDLAAALPIGTPALFALPLTLYGTAEQRETSLPRFLDARPALPCSSRGSASTPPRPPPPPASMATAPCSMASRHTSRWRRTRTRCSCTRAMPNAARSMRGSSIGRRLVSTSASGKS